MSDIPPELKLDFVEDEPPAVYTDVPELKDQDEPMEITEIKAMSEKNPIDDTEIFSTDEPSQEKTPPPTPVKEVNKRREKPVKYNKNGTVRKPRQYTEEQRKAMSERMKKVRLEAGKNKAKKDEEKAKDKTKIKRAQSGEPKKETPKSPPVSSVAPSITRADIERAQFEAIAKYETLRKERKQKKKTEQAVKQYHEDVKTNLQKELSWRDVAGPYSNCF